MPYRSPSIAKLTAAMIAFSKEVGPVHKGAENPFFNSKYADLSTVIEATTGPLAENGLSLTIMPDVFEGITETVIVEDVRIEDDDESAKNCKAGTKDTWLRSKTTRSVTGANGLRVTLTHVSGEWFEGRLLLSVAKLNDPQAMGSAMTYALRYIRTMVLCLATEDDDGNRASGRGRQPAQRPFAQRPTAKPAQAPRATGDAVVDHFEKTAPTAQAPAPPAPPKPAKEFVASICAWLIETEGTREAAQDKLEELSSFTGKDGKPVPGKRSTADLSPARLQVTYGKVKEYHAAWEKQHGGQQAAQDGAQATPKPEPMQSPSATPQAAPAPTQAKEWTGEARQALVTRIDGLGDTGDVDTMEAALDAGGFDMLNWVDGVTVGQANVLDRVEAALDAAGK